MAVKCACLRNDFNIYLTHTDCRYMVIEDQSDWMLVDGYEKPETFRVNITNLETGQSVSPDLYTSQRNRLSWGQLTNSDPHICIPDGLYCFEVVNCGTKYKVIRAYLCNVQCKIDELLAKAETREDKDTVAKLQLMVESIMVDTKLGKTKKASETFQLLNKRLLHLTCHSCGCK